MNNQEKFIEIYRACIQREGSEAFLDYLLEKTDFFTAPASTRFHGAYEGGLLEHSLNVYECLCDFVKRVLVVIACGDLFSLAACAVFHSIILSRLVRLCFFLRRFLSMPQVEQSF